MKKTRVIAFATQKGGAGKSTIGTHMASALCYLYGYKVAMLDCDFPQHTLQTYRSAEQQKLKTNEDMQARLVSQGIAPYPIGMSSIEKAVEAIDAFSAKGFDFVFIDTPGTVNVVGLPQLLLRVDYIFLPMEPDLGTISSTMSYMHILGDFLHSKNEQSSLVGFYAFWNKYLKSEKKEIYAKTDALFKQRGYPLLNSRVDLLVSVKDKRSTLFPMPEKELGKMGLGRLLHEVLTLIGEGPLTPSGKAVGFTPIAWPELEESNSSATNEGTSDENPADEGTTLTLEETTN